VRAQWVLIGLSVLGLAAARLPAQETRQATGVKVGEVTDTSAVVWTRLTAKAGRNTDGPKHEGRAAEPLPKDVNVDTLHGACPGATGQVLLSYGKREDLKDGKSTGWTKVTADTDFTHQFRLTGLEPSTVYHYAVETAGPKGEPKHAARRGRFETAPPAKDFADVTFTAVTCQGYRDVDHADGYHIYEAMAKLKPKFFVPNGDNVYYDSDDPLATSVAVARYHWHRLHSLPRHVAFHAQVPGYWTKDDHDCYADDCWPGKQVKKMEPLTFLEGLKVFREQVPMGEKTYRTFRWGKGLQVWLVEGRDCRSPNTMDDGPNKSIWGKEQKQWLLKTLAESDTDWKVLLTPTPIVGPDRENKADNHSNKAFTHEGDEFRRWAQKNLPDNFFVVCGDRHWQYHSVHPKTKVREFSCGPAGDDHASGTPGENKDYHRFHRVKGGFLSVAVGKVDGKSAITFRLHDVHGKVVHEYKQTQGERSR
jgi:alkaline phosphatase D